MARGLPRYGTILHRLEELKSTVPAWSDRRGVGVGADDRELDAEIARGIGLQDVRPGTPLLDGSLFSGWEFIYTEMKQYSDGVHPTNKPVPHFSTDIKAAIPLADAFDVFLIPVVNDDKYMWLAVDAENVYYDDSNRIVIEPITEHMAKTISKAICLCVKTIIQGRVDNGLDQE